MVPETLTASAPYNLFTHVASPQAYRVPSIPPLSSVCCAEAELWFRPNDGHSEVNHLFVVDLPESGLIVDVNRRYTNNRVNE